MERGEKKRERISFTCQKMHFTRYHVSLVMNVQSVILLHIQQVHKEMHTLKQSSERTILLSRSSATWQ